MAAETIARQRRVGRAALEVARLAAADPDFAPLYRPVRRARVRLGIPRKRQRALIRPVTRPRASHGRTSAPARRSRALRRGRDSNDPDPDPAPSADRRLKTDRGRP